MPVFVSGLGTAFRIDATKDKSVIVTPRDSDVSEATPPPMMMQEKPSTGVSPVVVIGALALVGALLYFNRADAPVEA